MRNNGLRAPGYQEFMRRFEGPPPNVPLQRFTEAELERDDHILNLVAARLFVDDRRDE